MGQVSLLPCIPSNAVDGRHCCFILLSAELHCVPLKRVGLCSGMQLLLKEFDPFKSGFQGWLKCFILGFSSSSKA